MKLLLVEDHAPMRDMIAAHLRDGGFVVACAGDASAALSAAESGSFDAIILDLGLPDRDGMAVLRALRDDRSRHLPVLVLTARDSLSDRLCGLNGGADDYLVKPFELAELEARLRAILRRPGPRRADIVRFADLAFDPANRTATLNDLPLDLTRRETAVFEALVGGAGRIVVKDTLEDHLYGLEGPGSRNALEAVVSRLRRKLAATESRVAVEAVRGIGYRLRSGPTA